MHKVLLTFLLALTISFSHSQNIEELEKKFIFDDLGVYLESIPATDTDPDRYSIDNRAYRIKKKFTFDYFIVRKGDTLKIAAPKISKQDVDFERDWTFLPVKEKHADKIETISITVLPGVTNENQTTLKYEYQYIPDSYSTYSSTSGVIENAMNTWMHPHRDKYFMILELNPFPYIQKPFRKGNKWTWSLGIGPYWQDARWKNWVGSIKNEYQYEIIEKVQLHTKAGKMECWVVQSTATSAIGTTSLISYYNEEHGFVKLDYTNIDDSKLIIELSEVRFTDFRLGR